MLATLLFAASGASDAEHFPAEPSAAEASALRSLIASGTTLAQNAQHCVTQPELMANYSWMGQLVHYSADGCASLCAGALVAPGTFLTAAHCLFKDDRVTPQFGSVLDPSGYKVVLGTIGPMRSHAARAVRRAEQCTLDGMVGADATFPIPGCTKGAEGWRTDYAPAAAGPDVSVLEVGAVFARNGLASHGVEMPNDWVGYGYGDVGVVVLRASACNATTNGTAFGRGAHAALRLNAGELLDAPDQWPRTFGWGNVGGAAPGDAAIGTSPFLKRGDMRLRAQGTLSGQCTPPNLALGLAAMPGTLCGCRSGAARQKSCLTSASADWRVQHGPGYTTPGLGDSGGPWVSNGATAGTIAVAETFKGGSEVQTLTCTATTGTFKLTHGGQETTALAFDATATQVQTALVALSTIASATVTFSTGAAAAACSGAGVGIAVKFTGSTVDEVLLTKDVTSLGGGTITVVETKKGGREVQTLTCTATLGTFKLTHGAATTSALAFDATATQVQTALVALSTIASATVTFSTGTAACSGAGVGMVVTFTGSNADEAALTKDLALWLGATAGTSFHIGLYSGGSAVANIQQFTRTFRYRCWIRDLINAFDPCVNLNRTAARRCEAVDRRFSQTVGLTETLLPTVPNGPKTCAPSFVGVPSAGAPGALAVSREVCANGTEYHAPTPSPTPSPTPFPTNFPTPAPTPAPTPSGTPKWELQVDDAGMIRSLKRPACEPPLCAQRIEGLELVTGAGVSLDDSFLALAADESGAGSLLDRPTRVLPHPRAPGVGDPRFGFGGGFDGWSLQYDRVLVPAIFSDGHGSVVPGGVAQADATAAHTVTPSPSLMDLKVQYNVTVREVGEGLDARPCLCQSLSLQLDLPDHAADLLLLHPRSATQFNVPLQWLAHLAHNPRVMPPHFSPRADGPLGAWDLFNVGNLTHPTGEPSDVWCENWTNTTSHVVCHLNPRADTSMCPFNYGLLV